MKNIKSPFKPINSSNDPFLDFMREEAKNVVDKEEVEIREIREDQEDFKPEIKEPKPKQKSTLFNIEIEERDLVVKQRDWSKLLASLYIDVFNADLSSEDIAIKIKEIMTRNGIDVNTSDVDATLSNTQDRLLKLFIAKNMCYSLGMASDWKEILSRELDLVYPASVSANKNKQNQG